MGSALVDVIPFEVRHRRKDNAGQVHVIVSLRSTVIRQQSRSTTVKQLTQCHLDNGCAPACGSSKNDHRSGRGGLHLHDLHELAFVNEPRANADTN
jgi:hypothetical protein